MLLEKETEGLLIGTESERVIAALAARPDMAAQMERERTAH